MRHPDRFLSQDETVVFDVHHHPSVLLPPLLPALVVFATWIAGMTLSKYLRGGWAVLAGSVITLALFLFFLSRLAAWSRARLVLTDRRLIYSYGVIARHSTEVSLASVTDVSFHQGLLERLLGMGDVTVEAAGEPALPYVRLPRPATLAANISEQARNAAGAKRQSGPGADEIALALKMAQPTSELPSIPPERPPLYSEIVDQIERLDALRMKGTLTEEEFAQVKKDLLSKMGPEEN